MENVFITLIDPDGHEFTFLRDELMAFHKRIVLRTDPETGKNKHFTVTVLYFKNKAEFTLDVSPEDVREALEAPEKIEEARFFAQSERNERLASEPIGFITSDQEFEVRLKELNDQARWKSPLSSIVSHNWEWGNPFGSQTYLP